MRQNRSGSGGHGSQAEAHYGGSSCSVLPILVGLGPRRSWGSTASCGCPSSRRRSRPCRVGSRPMANDLLPRHPGERGPRALLRGDRGRHRAFGRARIHRVDRREMFSKHKAGVRQPDAGGKDESQRKHGCAFERDRWVGGRSRLFGVVGSVWLDPKSRVPPLYLPLSFPGISLFFPPKRRTEAARCMGMRTATNPNGEEREDVHNDAVCAGFSLRLAQESWDTKQLMT